MIYQVRDKRGNRLYRIKVLSYAHAVAFVSAVYNLSIEDCFDRLTLVDDDPPPHVYYDFSLIPFDCED